MNIFYDIPSGEFRLVTGSDTIPLGDYIEVERTMGEQVSVSDVSDGEDLGMVPVIVRHSLEHDGVVSCVGWLMAPIGPFLDLLLNELIGFQLVRLRGRPTQLPAVNGTLMITAGQYMREPCNN